MVWSDKRARILLGEPFGLSFAPFIYESELNDGHCTIFLAMGCQPLLPSLAIPGLPFLPNQPIPD